MPADSETPAPKVWRPLGVRLAALIFGGGLLIVCAMAWIGFSDEIRDRFTFPQKLTLVAMGAMTAGALQALSRSRVVADENSVMVVNGFRKRVFARHQVIAVSLSRSAPWATLDLADGTSVAAMGIQGSDGDRARTAVRELRQMLNSEGPDSEGPEPPGR